VDEAGYEGDQLSLVMDGLDDEYVGRVKRARIRVVHHDHVALEDPLVLEVLDDALDRTGRARRMVQDARPRIEHFALRVVERRDHVVHIDDESRAWPGGFCPSATECFQEGFQTKGLKLT
jgi:hypothetical protein